MRIRDLNDRTYQLHVAIDEQSDVYVTIDHIDPEQDVYQQFAVRIGGPASGHSLPPRIKQLLNELAVEFAKYSDCPYESDARRKFDQEQKAKEQTEKRKCGQCAHYMPYCGSDEHSGDCGSVTFNKECYEGQNPFQDTDIPIVQVSEDEVACGLFSKRRTGHVKKWKKAHPGWYKQD